MKRNLYFFVIAWVFLFRGASAWAEFYVVSAPSGVGTRITTVPYTINNPGFYYFTSDLTSTTDGIDITVDNVTIDFMGFSLIGPGSSGTAVGINIGGHDNVEVRNGTVRNFPGDGISSTISGGEGNRIINMRLHGNGGRGLHMVGSDYLVQNCNVSRNGTGISLSGYGLMVVGNIVSENTSTGINCTGSGISLLENVVSDNGGYGFNISYVCTSCVYLFDRNTAYNNGNGTLNGVPVLAVWGINSGPGFP